MALLIEGNNRRHIACAVAVEIAAHECRDVDRRAVTIAERCGVVVRKVRLILPVDEKQVDCQTLYRRVDSYGFLCGILDCAHDTIEVNFDMVARLKQTGVPNIEGLQSGPARVLSIERRHADGSVLETGVLEHTVSFPRPRVPQCIERCKRFSIRPPGP